MVSKIGSQVKGFVDGSAERLKELRGKGKAVAEKVRAEGEKVAGKMRETVEGTASKGTKVLTDMMADLSLKDLMERFGTLKFPELLEKLKSSEITRHTEALRTEILTALRIPTIEAFEKLSASVDKLAKEVSSLKGIKTELKALKDEVRSMKASEGGSKQA